MTKYGRTPRFGYSVRPTATDPTRPLRLAALAETLGLDYIGIQQEEPGAEHHDSWTLLTAIGAATSRMGLIAKGQDLLLHSPPMVAKVAASLDLLTNGRVEIVLGKNCFMDTCSRGSVENGDSEEVTLAVLEEAISLMRLVWSGEPLETFAGKYFSLADVESTLIPARRIDIWMDANSTQALGLAGRFADGWIPESYPLMGLGDLAALSKQLDDSALSAQRQPTDIQRIWQISGFIETEEIGSAADVPFLGSARQWAESLSKVALEVGIDTFILMEGEDTEGEDAEAQLEKFALEVVPMVREMVELAPGVTILSGISRAYQGAAASGPTRAEEITDNLDWVDATSMESFPASDPPASSSFT